MLFGQGGSDMGDKVPHSRVLISIAAGLFDAGVTFGILDFLFSSSIDTVNLRLNISVMSGVFIGAKTYIWNYDRLLCYLTRVRNDPASEVLPLIAVLVFILCFIKYAKTVLMWMLRTVGLILAGW